MWQMQREGSKNWLRVVTSTYRGDAAGSSSWLFLQIMSLIQTHAVTTLEKGKEPPLALT